MVSEFVNKVLRLEPSQQFKLDQETQTDDDFLVQELRTGTQELLERLKSIHEHYSLIKQALELVQNQQSEAQRVYDAIISNVQTMVDYFKGSRCNVKTVVQAAKDVVHQQVLTSEMTEALINDLMDLAKLENNKFSLQKEYFSLPMTIWNSMQIMITTANKKGIKLRAEIDLQSNLELISSILGDEHRYQ